MRNLAPGVKSELLVTAGRKMEELLEEWNC